MLLTIHLSDVHLRADRANPAIDRISAVPRVAMDLAPLRSLPPTDVLVLISGDLANSGKEAEYGVADDLFDRLDVAVKSTFGVTPRWVVAPGNHDCDYSGPRAEIRARLVEDVSPSRVTTTYVDECLWPQSAFRAFLGRRRIQGEGAGLVSLHRMDLACGGKLCVRVINTAWMSQRGQSMGSIVVPVALLDEAAVVEGCDLVITMFHHPYSWHEPHSRRAFREWVEANSDIVVTGHEHDSATYRKRARSSSSDFLEAGPLQTHDDPEMSTLNLISIDFSSRRQSTAAVEWTSGSYAVDSESAGTPLLREREQYARMFPVTDDHSQWTSDLGAAYAHPRQRDVALNDLFVFPPLEEVEISLRERGRPTVIKDRQIDLLRTRGKCIVIGADRAGKTSVAKHYCYELRRSGIVTVALSGKDLKDSCRELDIDEWIALGFTRTFGPDKAKLVEWRRLDRERKAIVVDDFHHAAHSSAKRERVCKLLAAQVSTILLLADDTLGLEELSTKANSPHLWSFSRFRIGEMGYEARGALIERWCRLGADEGPGDPRLSARVLAIEKQVDAMMRENLLPSFASYVLLLISLVESGMVNSVSSHAGSSAILFEAMLTRQMSELGQSVSDIATMNTYLSFLAFGLFESQSPEMSMAEFKERHGRYVAKYDVDVEAGAMLDALARALVLEKKHDRVRFKFPYARHYFVARYFAKNLGDAAIQRRVADLPKHLYRDEDSSIFLFLCYLAEGSGFVLELAVSSARERFADAPLFDLDATVSFVSHLVSDLPDAPVLLSDEAHEANRARLRAARDQADEMTRSSEGEVEESELAYEFVGARRAVQILGQILRNAPGSIEGPRKQEIAEEAYALSLRLLGRWFELVQKHRDDLIYMMTEAIRVARPEEVGNDSDFEQRVRGWLFRLCAAALHSEARHVSGALGSDALSPTFNRLEKQYRDRSTSYALIDVSIRLDLNRAFPRAELGALAQRLRGNPLGWTVIQWLATHHLRVFPRSVPDRQFVRDKLEVRIVNDEDVVTSERKRFKR